MNDIGFSINHYALFLLVLLRVVAFIGASPLLSMSVWPASAKLGLAGFAAILAVPQIHATVPNPAVDPGNYIVYALLETAVGLLLGLIAQMIFAAISVAGQLFDIQIGFSAVTLFDPAAGGATGLTSTFANILFTLYFLGLNGLGGLVLAVLNSYTLIPVGAFHLPNGFWQLGSHLLGTVMTVGVEMAAPLLAALFLSDASFALLSRAVPQMNVFVVGLPVKLFLGLTMFAVAMPGAVYLFGQLFDMVFQQLSAVLQFLGGSV